MKIVFCWNRFLFPIMSKFSHIYFAIVVLFYLMYLWSLLCSLIRRIIHVIFTHLSKRKSSKERELKERPDSHLSSESLTFCSCLHLLNFFEYPWRWTGMSSGKQPQKSRCHFYFGSAKIHILDQPAINLESNSVVLC